MDKAQVKEGLSFNDDEDITPQYENEVRSHYGVGGSSQESADKGAYGDYYGGKDELRVQRVEEELRAGTREREAGALKVRKRVRTDREQISVPTRHEKVSVERVPVEGREAPEAEIGEDEVSMPVVEEEVVVEKRPVVKEELRIRKDVVEDEEIVEEDVRKEEVDVEDATTTRSRSRDAGIGDETGRRGR